LQGNIIAFLKGKNEDENEQLFLLGGSEGDFRTILCVLRL